MFRAPWIPSLNITATEKGTNVHSLSTGKHVDVDPSSEADPRYVANIFGEDVGTFIVSRDMLHHLQSNTKSETVVNAQETIEITTTKMTHYISEAAGFFKYTYRAKPLWTAQGHSYTAETGQGQWEVFTDANAK